ncbi:MAG: hypothetical protein FJX68_12775 [Alphaproteobacteria bacterium]|nr:hypothetical protein [Alphaproteobacteria bacterium]
MTERRPVTLRIGQDLRLAGSAGRRRFDGFPVRQDPFAPPAGPAGGTGYPTIDARSRQLWQTGGMQHCWRMAVAAFPTRHRPLPRPAARRRAAGGRRGFEGPEPIVAHGLARALAARSEPREVG